MGELEELIAEMKANKQFDALEMEFIHTRAKGILQLLQLLGSKNEVISESVLNEPTPDTVEVKEEVKFVDNSVQYEQADNNYNENVQEEIDFQPEDVEQNEIISQQTEPVEQENEVVIENSEETNEENEKDDDMLEEEEVEKAEAVSRLGDSFLKGKSVNDLITDHNKLEFKLSNRPVGSIQAAIGINDRFQYIRELFDGNNQKFLETVKVLDSKDNIKEAVDYLRFNFKWKKNETSLKFVNLVKRRFLHE